MNIGIVSGYFNPLHRGHMDYIHASRLWCNILLSLSIMIFTFMDQNHRCIIMDNLRDINKVILSVDNDKSVCKTLEFIRSKHQDDNLSFFNSRDRVKNNIESTEIELCKKN